MRLELEWAAIAASALVIAAGGAWLLRHRHPQRTVAKTHADSALVVPRASTPIVDDGEFEEDAWRTAALGGSFRDSTGGEARPHSELRFLWDDAGLHLAIYAADGDIEGSDAFSLHVAREGAPAIELVVSPMAVSEVAPAHRVLSAGHDVDGTVGNPRDDDEEWVTELTIPWSSLGTTGRVGERFVVSAERCDDPKDGGRRCGSSGAITLLLQ